MATKKKSKNKTISIPEKPTDWNEVFKILPAGYVRMPDTYGMQAGDLYQTVGIDSDMYFHFIQPNDRDIGVTAKAWNGKKWNYDSPLIIYSKGKVKPRFECNKPFPYGY